MGHKYQVDRIPEDDVELLEYFVDNSFLPGTILKLLDVSRSRGVITLQSESQQLVFSMDISRLIWVRPCDDRPIL